MGFLSIIGLIALLLLGKFLWDTILSGNEELVENTKPVAKPVDIANKKTLGIQLNPDKSGLDKAKSLMRISKNMNCPVDEVKSRYKKLIYDMGYEKFREPYAIIFYIDMALRQIDEQKILEADEFGLHPDDTPGALMEGWLKELQDDIREKQKG